MTHIVVLKSAQADFNELRSVFKAHHTAAAHAQFIVAFRQLFSDLKTFPDSGTPVEAAREVGMDVRQRLCEEIRVLYHHDRTHDIVYIRMFLPTRRDFLTHLTKRILRPDF
ncbi:type II toxin-antitoxin system RelE/ParE family toxin [Janthinobacterium sp. TB1-E2]|uniref:Type II toxin-antitoxin system RelE/ParE family toxin n=1 Tax=Janthinobacterium aestuarii TaxID=2985511 RepID=A0ABZ2GG21_9BURK